MVGPRRTVYQLPKDWGTTGHLDADQRRDRGRPDVEGLLRDCRSTRAGSSSSTRRVSLRRPLKALGYSSGLDRSGEPSSSRARCPRALAPTLALDSRTAREPMKTEEAVLGLPWTGGIDEMLGDPHIRRHQVPDPRGRDAVLDGHPDDPEGAPHLEMAPTSSTSSTSPRSRPWRPRSTTTRRRTRRRRSTSIRRSSTTRSCSCPRRAGLRLLEARQGRIARRVPPADLGGVQVEHRRLISIRYEPGERMTAEAPAVISRPPAPPPSVTARRVS